MQTHRLARACLFLSHTLTGAKRIDVCEAKGQGQWANQMASMLAQYWDIEVLLSGAGVWTAGAGSGGGSGGCSGPCRYGCPGCCLPLSIHPGLMNTVSSASIMIVLC